MTLLEELLAYVALDDADRTRLRALHERLAPSFPAIANLFYDAINASPGARSVLHGPAQIARLHGTLVDWMSTGLLGPYDDRFYEKRSRIGRRHVVIGLEHQYMFAAMNTLRTAYHDQIIVLYPSDQALAVMRSVNKLLDVELAIMVQHYHLDSEERLIARERTIQGDRILALQTMSAGLAHELRNPLNAAKLQLELLERRLRKQSDEPRLLEPAELAQSEIQRLTNLLGDFLAFARPSELNPERHDVAAIVRHVVELERLGAERKGAKLEVIDSPRELHADIDAPKMHQILHNLVRNSVEAVPAGGHIAVGLVSHPTSFKLRVEDDGPGIPDAVRQRIFEPFFSTKEGGTGLGMSIVHSLVTLHGGVIELDTSPRGTRFDVSIPVRS
ncbi:MAG: hypothetical protein HOV81_15840 [Kofleriaceae bacterium]|nr:hypothetical protein [Kofleriaceae bacterium]